MGTQIFTEALDISEAQPDIENRILRGVILIRSGTSLNKRHYSEGLLQKSVGIFESSKAYDNHSGGARSIRDITGFYKNVRYENGALKGDRYFTRTQAGNDAWAIAQEVASGNAPKNLAGLSINAVGTAKKHATEDGVLEIESITAAISVDDVSEAGAKGAYVESGGNDLTTAFWEAVSYDEYQQARPDFIDRLKKEWKQTRQDDALKAALAESEALKAELETAQATIKTLQGERDTAIAEKALASRENHIESALGKASVPTDWKKALRESLLKADETAWADIIKSEESKAKSAGHKTPVTGASQQINTPLRETPKAANAPYDLSNVESPEAMLVMLEKENS